MKKIGVVSLFLFTTLIAILTAYCVERLIKIPNFLNNLLPFFSILFGIGATTIVGVYGTDWPKVQEWKRRHLGILYTWYAAMFCATFPALDIPQFAALFPILAAFFLFGFYLAAQRAFGTN